MLNRLKEIRKLLDLTQVEMASSLNIKQPTYSMIEKGQRALTDRTIKTLCYVHNINENWLRTGNGSIFSESDTEREFCKVFSELNSKYQEYILEIMNALIKQQNENL